MKTIFKGMSQAKKTKILKKAQKAHDESLAKNQAKDIDNSEDIAKAKAKEVIDDEVLKALKEDPKYQGYPDWFLRDLMLPPCR